MPGVVGAEDPLGPPPAHAVVADQRVLDRAVERVAHVQRAGDVRRRDRDRVVLVRRALGLGVVAGRDASQRSTIRGSTSAGSKRVRSCRLVIGRESLRSGSARTRPQTARHRGEVAPERRQVELRRQPAHVAALARRQVARAARATCAAGRPRCARSPGVSFSQCSRATTRASKRTAHLTARSTGERGTHTEASAPGADACAVRPRPPSPSRSPGGRAACGAPGRAACGGRPP